MDTHVEVSECTPSPFILVVLLKLNAGMLQSLKIWGGQVVMRRAAHWNLLEILVWKFKCGNQLVLCC